MTVEGFVEGALMARANAHERRRMARRWENKNPAFAVECRLAAQAAFERGFWALHRAMIERDKRTRDND